MGKIIDFKTIAKEEATITVSDRSNPNFLDAAYALGEYLLTLPLSNDQHNELVKLISEQISEAEIGSWNLGLGLGLHLNAKKKELEL